MLQRSPSVVQVPSLVLLSTWYTSCSPTIKYTTKLEGHDEASQRTEFLFPMHCASSVYSYFCFKVVCVSRGVLSTLQCFDVTTASPRSVCKVVAVRYLVTC